MESNFVVSNDSENASFVNMISTNQMMPPVALYSTEAPYMDSYSNDHVMDYSPASPQNGLYPINTNQYALQSYVPQQHITSTPVVKSHANLYSPVDNASQHYTTHHLPPQQQLNFDIGPTINNLGAMDIDDYFAVSSSDPNAAENMFIHGNTNNSNSNAMQNMVYSPSSNSVTTNSSIIMIDTAMSPSSPINIMSPTHLMSPIQSMDPFVAPINTTYQHMLMGDNSNGMTDTNSMYPEPPVVPTSIGMVHTNFSSQINNGRMYAGSNGHDDVIYQQQQHHLKKHPSFERKGRRPLPRRHTVSTPYATNLNNNVTANSNISKVKEPMPTDVNANKNEQISPMLSSVAQQQPIVVTKSRKSSLKAKRHRSLGKLDIYSTSGSGTPTSPPPIPDLASAFEPLSAKLELWTHQQLLERVMQLEKEKTATAVAQGSLIKTDEVTPDENGKSNKKYPNNCEEASMNGDRKASEYDASATRYAANKIRSASQTDTEIDDEDEEEDEPQTCKWEDCSLELNSLESLIDHVKLDHIGSGKPNYYCRWEDCARQQKPFTKRHKMHNHLRTHTGERPFICEEPECGKRFSRPDSLTTHKKIHSNIRPYLCQNVDCGKAYYHLRSLRKHERTHLSKDESIISETPPPLPTTTIVKSNINAVVSQMAFAPVSIATATASNGILYNTHSSLNNLDEQQNLRKEEEMFSDWGLAAQDAVFSVMDREKSYNQLPSYM